MKIKMNYFTSTGNTLWVANEIKKNFETLGHEVEIFDSVTSDVKCFDDCDAIGFIYPVWGSTMPNHQRYLLSKLPEGTDKKIFFIGNAGVFNGDTGIYYKKIADAKGYDTIYVDHVFMPINSIFPGFTFFKQPSKEKIIKMKEKAKKRLKTICENITNGKRKYNGRRLIQRIGGRGQRNNYDPIIDNFKKQMFIDQDKCSKCGLCYKICPQNAISKADDGCYRIDTNDCILCLKCYNLCPNACALKEAISSDVKKYPRYRGLDKSVKPITYR